MTDAASPLRGAPGLLAAAAVLLATALPARGATRISPTEAMRVE